MGVAFQPHRVVLMQTCLDLIQKNKLQEKYNDTMSEKRRDVLEYRANLQFGDEKTQILKTALKFICNDIATIDLDASVQGSDLVIDRTVSAFCELGEVSSTHALVLIHRGHRKQLLALDQHSYMKIKD